MRSQVTEPGFATRWLRAGACIMTLALLAACASTPPPHDQMQRAQNALKQARQAGASDYDPVDLKFASGKFQQAQAAMAKKDYDTAALRAQESQADAQLAYTRSRLAVERQKVQTQTQENARLRKQLLGHTHASGKGGVGPDHAPAVSSSTLTLPEQVLPQPPPPAQWPTPVGPTPPAPAPAPASSSPSDGGTQGGGA